MAATPTGGGTLPSPVHFAIDGPPFSFAPPQGPPNNCAGLNSSQPNPPIIATTTTLQSLPSTHASFQTKPYPLPNQSTPFIIDESATTPFLPPNNDTEFPPLPSHLHHASVKASTILNPNAPPRPSKSFIDIVTSLKSCPASIPVKPMTYYRGEPAVIFSTDEISIMAIPFKLSLIGKFSFGRPSMDIIRKFFISLGLKGSSQVSLLDQRHVIINLSLEEDYTRVWTRQAWFINGKAMRIFKWSPNFRCAEESPIVPVWISLPYLPIHYVNCKQALYSIAAAVGKPLRVDHATATGNRPSVARILIEYDISKPLLPRIWIGEGSEGFWQDITFEKVPAFCLSCKHLGHEHNTCYISNPELRKKFISKRKTPVSKNSEGVNEKGLAGRDTIAFEKNDRVDLSGVDGQGVEYGKSRLVEEIVHGIQDNSGLQNDSAKTTQHASSSPTLVPYSGLVSGQIGTMSIAEAGTALGRENATCPRLASCQSDGFKAAQDEATPSLNQPSMQDDFPHSAVAMTDVGVSVSAPGPCETHALTLAQEDATPRTASVITLGQLHGPHSQQHYEETRVVQPIVESNLIHSSGPISGPDLATQAGHHLGEELVATLTMPDVGQLAPGIGPQEEVNQPIEEGKEQPHFQPNTRTNSAQQTKERRAQPIRPISAAQVGVTVSAIEDLDQENSLAQVDFARGLDSNLGHQPNLHLHSDKPLASVQNVSKRIPGPTEPSHGSPSNTSNSFSFQAGHHISYNPLPTVVVVDSLPMPRPTYASEDYITDGTVDDPDSFYMPDHSRVEFNTHSAIIPDENYYGPVSSTHSLDDQVDQESHEDNFLLTTRCGVSDSDVLTKVTPRKARQYHLRSRNRRR